MIPGEHRSCYILELWLSWILKPWELLAVEAMRRSCRHKEELVTLSSNGQSQSRQLRTTLFPHNWGVKVKAEFMEGEAVLTLNPHLYHGPYPLRRVLILGLLRYSTYYSKVPAMLSSYDSSCFLGNVGAELGKTLIIKFLYTDNILVPRHGAVC